MAAKKAEEASEEVVTTEASAPESEKELEEPKVVRRRAAKTLTVKLKVKQLIHGKRGFIDEEGTIKLLEGMPFRVGEHQVDEAVWDAAELYKPLH